MTESKFFLIVFFFIKHFSFRKVCLILFYYYFGIFVCRPLISIERIEWIQNHRLNHGNNYKK